MARARRSLRGMTARHPALAGRGSARLSPDAVLRSYFRAKDENRPHVLHDVFSPVARLEMIVRASTISFPAVTIGRDAIADVLVRGFGQTYENVYSFYLERPAAHARTFACDWLVAMSDKRDHTVRVGCGRYEWTFDDGSGLATGLVITIEAMQLLAPLALEETLGWIRRLDYPWSSAGAVANALPQDERLRSVLDYLGRGASAG
jgi:hypothetical protein